jgi:hypothetical protein
MISSQRYAPSSAFGTFSPASGGEGGGWHRLRENATGSATICDNASFSPPQRGEGAEGG